MLVLYYGCSKIEREVLLDMPETIEEWAWLIIGVIFIGFIVLVIGLIFHSLIVWLCLGLLAGIILLYPVIKNLLLAMINARRGRQMHGYKIGQHEWLMSESKRPQLVIPASKQQQLSAPKNKQQQLLPEPKKPSLKNPDAQHYVPPGLPPDFFL